MRPSTSLTQAIRDWDAEVDAEMVRLIESGFPPIDAARRAREIVSERRMSRASRPSEAKP